MSLSIDGRFENTYYLASNLKRFSEVRKQSQFEDNSFRLFKLLQRDGKNTTEHSLSLIRELESVQATAKIFTDGGLRSFEEQVIPAADLAILILCWRNFNTLKELISGLCDLSLVFPQPDNDSSRVSEINSRRNKLRSEARDLMPLGDLSFERFEKFFKLSEYFLAEVLHSNFDDCEELIQEYTEKHDELYCEALVSLK